MLFAIPPEALKNGTLKYLDNLDYLQLSIFMLLTAEKAVFLMTLF